MIGQIFTITNKAGDSISINDHTTDPTKIIALQSYPQFDVDIKNNEVQRDGQHGVWDFYSFYGRRVINFQGVIVCNNETDVENVKRDLVKILSLPIQPKVGDDGYVYLRWTDLNDDAWEIECKLLSTIQFNRSMQQNFRLDFNFSLKSADPFIYSQEVVSQVGVRGYQTTGARFPLSLPAILGSTNMSVLEVENAGSVQSNTIIRLYGETEGAITNPTITNLTTGKFMTVDVTLADETEWIEIDSRLGTVVDQNGDDVSAGITGESSFVFLNPGANELMYTSDQDPTDVLYYPSATFSVSFRDSKI